MPALALAFNALVWGVSWWPFRALEARGLHALWATALIFVFALCCLLVARPGAWRGFAGRPLLWVLMLATGMTNAAFNWAVTEGDVVRVVLLFYLMPAWSVALAWPMLGEKPTLASLLRVALALAGVAVVLKAPGMAWPVPSGLADWLAVLGGFGFALTNILLRRLADVPTASRVMAMFSGGAVVGCLAAVLGVTQGWVAPLPVAALSWLLIAGALAISFMASNLALQYGASRLSAHASSLIMLSEVIFASLSAVALGAADISGRTLAGGALILLAAVLSAWPSRPAPH
ncbi:MAG: DMT family transporter [Comamonadaceae bacterium]|nr:MAG: DMT family transporter [Comamonadaceae bacterium]